MYCKKWHSFGLWNRAAGWYWYAHARTQPFYGPVSGTTRVTQCQKKTFFWTLWCKGR